MSQLIRDTAFGHAVRFLSRGKLLRYQEEEDPSLYTKFIDQEKSGNLAHHGDTNPPDDDASEKENDDLDKPDRPTANGWSSSEASGTTGNDATVNEASGAKIDQEKGKDIHLVSWWGKNDPENPQNWSTFKKVFVTFEICLLTTSVYIGSSIYSAGTADVVAIFGVSQVAATLGLCLFVAGYGLGPMLWSPMSEIPQVGRNPIYLGTLVVFVALQPAVALASNFGMLLAFRFITGFFGSPVLATGGASLADIWSPAKRAYAMSIWGVAAICGPTLGPLIGGFAVQYGGTNGVIKAPWSWPIWELMWLSAFCLIFLVSKHVSVPSNTLLTRLSSSSSQRLLRTISS